MALGLVLIQMSSSRNIDRTRIDGRSCRNSGVAERGKGGSKWLNARGFKMGDKMNVLN